MPHWGIQGTLVLTSIRPVPVFTDHQSPSDRANSRVVATRATCLADFPLRVTTTAATIGRASRTWRIQPLYPIDVKKSFICRSPDNGVKDPDRAYHEHNQVETKLSRLESTTEPA